ncbi:luciferase domain-containing protein [Streptomyces sp. NPDC054765]
MTGPPAEQLTQNAPADQLILLEKTTAALRGVRSGASFFCPAGSRAFHLDHWLALGPPHMFFAGTEFAHLHPIYDGSVHLFLSPVTAWDVHARGWAAPPDRDGALLVYGPRDEAETEIVQELLLCAYRYARGTRYP